MLRTTDVLRLDGSVLVVCRLFPPVVVQWHTHIRHPIVLVMTKYINDIIMMTKYHHANNGNDNASPSHCGNVQCVLVSKITC